MDSNDKNDKCCDHPPVYSENGDALFFDEQGNIIGSIKEYKQTAEQMENTRQRKQISKEQIEATIEQLKVEIYRRLDQKGYGTFASIHEILGIVTEEHEELKDAVRNNNQGECYKELFDISVGAIFGATCIRDNALDW